MVPLPFLRVAPAPSYRVKPYAPALQMCIRDRDNLLKEDFLAKMSHEIRTPLTSILAFVDLWEQTNTPRDEGEGQIMSELQLSSQLLPSMVNNILDLSLIHIS